MNLKFLCLCLSLSLSLEGLLPKDPKDIFLQEKHDLLIPHLNCFCEGTFNTAKEIDKFFWPLMANHDAGWGDTDHSHC